MATRTYLTPASGKTLTPVRARRSRLGRGGGATGLLLYRADGTVLGRLPLPAVSLFGALLYGMAGLGLAVLALLVHTVLLVDSRGALQAMRPDPSEASLSPERREFARQLRTTRERLDRLQSLHSAINDQLFSGPGSLPAWYTTIAGSANSRSDAGRVPSPEARLSYFTGAQLRAMLAELDAYIGTNADHIQVYGGYIRGVPHRWPVANGRRKINSGFGLRANPFYATGGSGPRKLHRGVDLKAKRGDAVVAAAEGLVLEARQANYGYGNLVRIFHPSGYVTLYAHLSAIHVRPDQYLKPGDPVGAAGSSGHSTGPHLHYEVHRDGQALDPVEFIVED